MAAQVEITEEDDEDDEDLDLDAFEDLKGLIPDPEAPEAFAEMANLAKGFRATRRVSKDFCISDGVI